MLWRSAKLRYAGWLSESVERKGLFDSKESRAQKVSSYRSDLPLPSTVFGSMHVRFEALADSISRTVDCLDLSTPHKLATTTFTQNHHSLHLDKPYSWHRISQVNPNCIFLVYSDLAWPVQVHIAAQHFCCHHEQPGILAHRCGQHGMPNCEVVLFAPGGIFQPWSCRAAISHPDI